MARHGGAINTYTTRTPRLEEENATLLMRRNVRALNCRATL